MKKYFILSFLLIVQNLSAQSLALKTTEDSLFLFRERSLLEENDSIKLIWNKKFTALLQQTLAQTVSLTYSFDTLKSIAVLVPSDKSFRIFNWELSFSDNSIGYYGLIQSSSKKKNQVQVVELKDNSAQIKKPESATLDASNWYGAHYYKLIETQKKKKKYYTLLGANWSNVLIRKKIIDVVSIGPDGKIKFGDAIFQNNKQSFKRVLFHYAAEISMSLRYDENKQMILFDHLVPREPQLKGQYEFYGPDMSIDGYTFSKGKWNLKEDIDARNEKK